MQPKLLPLCRHRANIRKFASSPARRTSSLWSARLCGEVFDSAEFVDILNEDESGGDVLEALGDEA